MIPLTAEEKAQVNSIFATIMASVISVDMVARLNADGTPRHPDNDYERHLYARWLRQHGYDRQQVGERLLALGLSDIERRKQSIYVSDVISSPIVGF